MKDRLVRRASVVSLIISIVALIVSVTVVARAVGRREVVVVDRSASSASASKAKPHSKSRKPKHTSSATIGFAKKAREAEKLDGLSAEQVAGSCPPDTVDLGSWCLETAPYALTNAELGKNDYIYASKKCVELGGYLPSAAQLVGAANRVKLDSTIHDSQLTATIPLDPTRGLKDQREMSSTLITTQAGSDAAGSEGVSVGSTGNPQTGEPNPVPQPAVPEPETLQYVTVYSNGQKGGFAGSEAVSKPENFRCAYNKAQGALAKTE